ncbi:MAG: class I SAM-dependent methyltransferase [Planctomycetes bacterium]|nr:class I SAM-dependent methyltransferase [Planctomycetota bacterium]
MASWYEERIFNAAMDVALSSARIAALRAEVLREARGEVVEVGLGTGLNLPHYPSAVRRVSAVAREVELDARALARAHERCIELVHVRGDAQALPLDDHSVDTLVCTFVLCSVEDLDAAAREFARVLRPDGALAVLEHVVSPRKLERFVQRTLTPPHRIWACGCRLDRDIAASLERAGFDRSTLPVARSNALPFPAAELLCSARARRRAAHFSASTSPA